MNTIFTVDDLDDYNERINLDDLYEKKKQHDISTTNNYNKILSRIHSRIKTTSRLHIKEHHCWFVVPEMMIGVPRFDQGTCIAYLIDKLQNNGFKIRYTHPNLLFISWTHWIPDYVRTEIKKKTGVVVDGHGNIIKNNNDDDDDDADNHHNPNSIDYLNPNALLLNNNTNTNSNKKNQNEDTKSINSYKPSGQLIYNNDIINSLRN